MENLLSPSAPNSRSDKRKSPTTGPQLLLSYLIAKNGGIAAVARALSIRPQTIVNWRLRGVVPLIDAFVVGHIFNISPICLNYPAFCIAYRHTTMPSWADAVRASGLSDQQVSEVLYLPE